VNPAPPRSPDPKSRNSPRSTTRTRPDAHAPVLQLAIAGEAPPPIRRQPLRITRDPRSRQRRAEPTRWSPCLASAPLTSPAMVNTQYTSSHCKPGSTMPTRCNLRPVLNPPARLGDGHRARDLFGTEVHHLSSHTLIDRPFLLASQSRTNSSQVDLSTPAHTSHPYSLRSRSLQSVRSARVAEPGSGRSAAQRVVARGRAASMASNDRAGRSPHDVSPDWQPEFEPTAVEREFVNASSTERRRSQRHEAADQRTKACLRPRDRIVSCIRTPALS